MLVEISANKSALPCNQFVSVTLSSDTCISKTRDPARNNTLAKRFISTLCGLLHSKGLIFLYYSYRPIFFPLVASVSKRVLLLLLAC